MNSLGLTATLVLLAVCITKINAQNKEIDSILKSNRKKEVVWVNPKLPEGPGLEHKILDSKVMGHKVGYVVWTPKGYNSRGQRYPVVYFLHGMGGNESADSGGFSSWLQKAIDSEYFAPSICIFPNGGKSGYKGEVEKMIIDELVPLIDKEYPTRKEKGSKIITGFSMGGAGAVYLSIKHPNLFDGVGSMGGGIRGFEEMKNSIDMAVPIWKENHVRFFLANGEFDRPEAFKEFHQLQQEAGLESQLYILKDTKHNLGLYYEKSVLKLLQFLGEDLK